MRCPKSRHSVFGDCDSSRRGRQVGSRFREVETASPRENEIAREAITAKLIAVMAGAGAGKFCSRFRDVETASPCENEIA